MVSITSQRRYLYLDVRGELECSNDTEGYASNNEATGRVSLAGEVKSNDTD
jgi:hypothetical protein